MLFQLVRSLKPNVKISVELFKTNIEEAKASDFGNDVKLLLSYVNKNLTKIMKKDKTYKTTEFARRLFKVLATVENKEFEDSLAEEKRAWRKMDAKDFDIDVFGANMLSTFTNISAENEWKTTKSKDSKLIALTTQVENLQKELSSVKTGTKQFTPSGGTNRSTNNDYVIDDWRKKKSEGDEVSRDGKKYWWCPHHKNEEKGYPDGLYVTHSISDCRVAKRRKAQSDKSSSNSEKDKGKEPEKKTLSISDNLKAVLMARHCLTAEEAESVWKESSGN